MPGTIFCPACSAALPEGAPSCPTCGQAVPAMSADDTGAFRRFYTAPDPSSAGVVGFFRRFLGRSRPAR
ncbi:MAG: hypothetical protein ACRDXE_07285 [Acidimicrobiales bacterium]